MQTLSIKLQRTELTLETRPDHIPISVPDDHTPSDRLSGFYMPPKGDSDQPLVVLFHGMGGDACSGYMRSMAEFLNLAGYGVLLWNHRGAGRSAISCRYFHHPGFTDDVHRLVDYLMNERPKWCSNGLACAAFSLGANLLLKYLGETGSDSPIQAGVSISAPIDMELTSRNLRNGVNQFADRYLLKKQQSELLRDGAELTREERRSVSNAKSVWELDDRFTAKRFGYDNAETYYFENSAIRNLDQVRQPVLLLHAEDDPVVDPKVFAEYDWDGNSSLHPILAGSGGHTGFLYRDGTRWHETSAKIFLDKVFNR